MIKVCFLLGGLQGAGGIGRVTSILANAMSESGIFNVTILSYIRDERPILYRINESISQFSLFISPISMTKALLVGKAVQKIRQIIDTEKIDVLIACGALYFPLAIMASRGLDVKCICWEHTNPGSTSDYRFQNLARKFGVRCANHIVVLTKSAAEHYSKQYPRFCYKVSQIYNPVDQEAAKSLAYNESSKKIISVGRLSYPKNFERLMLLASKVMPNHPDWSWDIYGDGELRKSLEELRVVYGLTTQVHLKGQVSNLYELYQDYAFLVMTSRYEGFPMSLIEAAINRLPLLSFDIPTGPNEIIQNGMNGYLVKADDNKEMLAAIESLIINQQDRLRMSEASYHSSYAFNLVNILKRWEDLCNMLLQKED